MKKAIRIQQFIAVLAILLFVGKMIAWRITGSVTVLTDALEGIVNVVAGFLGLFSLSIAAKPRDAGHPYGHGKAQFLSAAVEGTMITVAGFAIIYEGIIRLIEPHELEQLDIGLAIVAGTGAMNFAAGMFAKKFGEKNGSMVLVSAGNHLVTDAYSGLAIIIGLTLLIFTKNKYLWLDSAVALCFAAIIVRAGYRVVRRAISGIMDETDMKLLNEVIVLLQTNRLAQWVDIHHLRLLNHSNHLHVDAHLTIPRYYNISDADAEVKAMTKLIKTHYGEVEVFIQIEGCTPSQCHLCAVGDCAVRSHAFQSQQQWVLENIWKETRHAS